MHTNSRIDGESSFKRHLSRENILSKLEEKKGHKMIVGYRGYRALSASGNSFPRPAKFRKGLMQISLSRVPLVVIIIV